MHKRIAGPNLYSEWVEALSSPLTYERAVYLQHGRLKDKKLEKTLFNRISDYVVDSFNRNVEAVKAADYPEIIYALRRFTAGLSQLLFFRHLSFLAEKNRQALLKSLTDATGELIKEISAKFNTQDADLLFELNTLRRKSGVGMHE